MGGWEYLKHTTGYKHDSGVSFPGSKAEEKPGNEGGYLR